MDRLFLIKIVRNQNFLADYQKNSWLLENKKILKSGGVFKEC